MGPEFGVTLEMVGAGRMYVNPFARLTDPLAVVTVTVAVPTVPAGVIAVKVAGLTTTTAVAGVSPTITDSTPVRFSPEIVMDVPPTLGPEFGVTDEMIGGETE